MNEEKYTDTLGIIGTVLGGVAFIAFGWICGVAALILGIVGITKKCNAVLSNISIILGAVALLLMYYNTFVA